MTIRYLTTFTYDAEVSESQNALRAKPTTSQRQQLMNYSVTVDPAVRIFSYTDYWGTQVDCFGVIGHHTRLVVAADSVVETENVRPPQLDTVWPPPLDPSAPEAEYLAESPHVVVTEEIADYAQSIAKGHRSTVEVSRAVQGAIGDLMTYVPGSTHVGVSVAEVFSQRSGVCQDYAHLALAVYRSLGIPARYVSGYLYAADASSGDRPIADEVNVSTHAWVEVLIPGFGWWGLDPTNQLEVGEQHVKIGHGRDYEDVTPLRGTYHGDAESGGLSVGVKMSRSTLDAFTMSPPPASIQRQHHQQ